MSRHNLKHAVSYTLYSFLLLTFFTAGQLQAQPKAPKGYKWEVVEELTDEFDFWDESKWHKTLWNYPPPVLMEAENSGVRKGKLWIRATLSDNEERWFQTSRVRSNAAIKFPMYTECRMKTSHLSAYNTYWLNKGNGHHRDEIDICENCSNPTKEKMADWAYTMHSQYFIVKQGDTERAKGNFDNRKLSDKNPMKGVKWNKKYHVLGLWWKDKNTLQFYINGEEAGSVTTKRDFTVKQEVNWDLWTSPEKWFCGMPDKKDLKNKKNSTMYVDWIHTYRLVKE